MTNVVSSLNISMPLLVVLGTENRLGTRKLKCSGETPACSRCEKEKIKCVYSPQKPMGRPRKRRRDENAPEKTIGGQPESTIPSCGSENLNFDDPALAATLDFSNLSDFSGFQSNSSFANNLPPSYPESVLGNGFNNDIPDIELVPPKDISSPLSNTSSAMD